jgi:toxin ParE1/3/4
MARQALRVVYSLRASKAAREHATYYEDRQPGLGGSFLAALREAERMAQANPTGFREVAASSEIRAIVIRRFPFRMLYALRGSSILVVAVAHTARKPDRYFSP